MKVAIIHDYLNQYGGAERVLESLLKIFPDAHIYTLLYDKNRTLGKFHNNIHKTSFLDFGLVRLNHRPFIPLMPTAVSTMTVDDDYDLVISATAGYAKGVSIRHRKENKSNPFHLSYCYTPLRYAWEIDNYFANPIFKTVFRPAFNYLKNWDREAAQKPDVLLTISKFIAGKIKAYYGREAEVIYPPVDYTKFHLEIRNPKSEIRNYYLAVGRLLHYKKFDLIVEAFRELGAPLKIVGMGPEYHKIKNQISPKHPPAGGATGQVNISAQGGSASGGKNIELIPFVSDDELRKLYNGAQALIFPQVEDFGLTAAEAQACGTPVIAFRGGGALEIVGDGVTGIFFEKQNVESLIQAVRRFEKLKFNRRKISQISRRFTFESFRKGLLSKLPKEIL